MLGDFIILLLLLMVKKSVDERPEWTPEMRMARRRKWFRRSRSMLWVSNKLQWIGLRENTYTGNHRFYQPDDR